MAVDGAGNVYIADSDNNRVIEVPVSGGPEITVASGLGRPSGVAVDGIGNLYIPDFCNNRVLVIPAAGGPQTTVGTGLIQPQGGAIDVLGNVIIADSGNIRVVKVTPDGIQITLPLSGLNEPVAVAVDAAGDVFVGNYYSSGVLELTPQGVQSILPITGLGSIILGVSVDGSGSLYIADFVNNRMVVMNRSLVPSQSFAPTNLGSTSVDSPQSFYIQNIGNQPLAGSLAFNLGGNFTQNATPDCSGSLPLAPGATCNESFSFTPQSGGSSKPQALPGVPFTRT